MTGIGEDRPKVSLERSRIQLDPEQIALVRTIAHHWCDRYLEESYLPSMDKPIQGSAEDLETIREALSCPWRGLHAFLGHYAFARRGKDRADLSAMAMVALRRIADPESMKEVLELPDGSILWESFAKVCEERKKKSNEQLNRGLLAGMLELSQEIYRLDGIGSVGEWISEAVIRTSRIETPFMRIVDIRGVGPKTTSAYIRDLVLAFGVEDQVDNVDRLYLQPIDRWLRLFAENLIPEIDSETTVDWVIAGKLSRVCRLAGVSGIRFNMGATYFGLKEVREPARFPNCLRDLIADPTGARSSG